jgi:integrase
MNTVTLAVAYPSLDVTGIDRLPSGRYRVRLQAKGSIVRPEPCDTIEEAIALRDAIREEIERGRAAPAAKTSVSTWGPTWLREHRYNNRNYKADLSRFKRHVATAAFAKLPIKTVETPDLVDWLRDLKSKKTSGRHGVQSRERLSWQTRKHCLNLVRVLFADAVQAGICKANPAIGLHVKKTDDERGEQIPEEWPLRPEEIAKIRTALADDPERWIIAFAIGTGLRQGEMWTLHLTDVHLDAPEGAYVNVRYGGYAKGKLQSTKTKRPRKVPLFGLGLEAARAWLELLPTYAPSNPLGLVFPKPIMASIDGTRGSKGGFRRYTGKSPSSWKKAKDALGADRKAWWHLLRHTCATALICGWWGRKWTLGEVAKLLGHKSVRTTEMYAHFLDSTLTDLAAETHEAWSRSGSNGLANGVGVTTGGRPTVVTSVGANTEFLQ